MVKGLGKGLGAIFQEQATSEKDHIIELNIKEIKANPYQPRKKFDEEALGELAQSIEEYGVLQPIIVRKKGRSYEIVAGERRFRASKQIGLSTVPVVVKELTNSQMMELAILENLQREDLTPIEEAEAYQNLMTSLGFTQEQLSVRLGKSRSHIANHLRLLTLPDEVRQFIADGKLSMGQGRTLVGIKKKHQIPMIAEKVIKQQLNVRQVETLVQSLNEEVSRETKPKRKKVDLFIQERENQLREHFGTSVAIKKMKDRGKIEIEFFSEDDLERILDLLNEQNEQ